MSKKLLTEFIGTFFLVLTVGTDGRSTARRSPRSPSAAPLMIMVYMGGHVSGGHYNPAVSLGVFLRGKLDSQEPGPYWVVQLAGAIAASLTRP